MKNNKMKNNNKRFIMTFVLILALAIGMTTTAFADTTGSTEATVEFSTDESVNKLELVTAPAFSFGSHDLPDSGQTIAAQSITGSLKTMDTTGNYAGWNVTATISNFSTASVSNSMPGAYITMSNGTADRVGSGTTDSPTVKTPIVLTSGSSDSTAISEAAQNAGVGTWDMNWLPSNTTLTVLDTPAVGQSTATITWTMVAGPLTSGS